MATKSVSSQPGRLTSVTSEDIKNKKWTKAQKETIRRHAARQAAGDESHINYEDIPPLTDEQLAGMVRLRDVRKVAVSVRLDPQVLDWLKKKGSGHLTRINDILANVMAAEIRHGNS
ncbi:MAG TPA: BrnA antitoxin family protein [Bryobacteraceae bacterium]